MVNKIEFNSIEIKWLKRALTDAMRFVDSQKQYDRMQTFKENLSAECSIELSSATMRTLLRLTNGMLDICKEVKKNYEEKSSQSKKNPSTLYLDRLSNKIETIMSIERKVRQCLKN